MPEHEHKFMDPECPVMERAQDLLSKLTLEEKIGQMLHDSPGIPRLGIPEYSWWSECLHGVGRAGLATVFPQAIGMAASFDDSLLFKVASAISDEARAKHHAAARNGNRGMYFGLTYWSPNINIFRDPRWGRGQETYGEDPFLAGRMGAAFVRGLQGAHPHYLKLVATPKHYAVHSGPEPKRHTFDARASGRDLRETYLPAFETCVREGGAMSVMGAYNRANGEPCCASGFLLQKILREEWGFKGCVVSDCGAIDDIHAGHGVTKTPAESAALAVRNGCDLNCGCTYTALKDAVAQGLITENEIDRSALRLIEARIRLGMFDPPEKVPFASIPASVVNCPKHRRLALQMARESIVLLQNKNSLLPLPAGLRSIAVVGPAAISARVLMGNYNGVSNRLVTILEGIVGAAPPNVRVHYSQGCDLFHADRGMMGEAAWSAASCDVIVAVMGLSPEVEGEEGDASDTTAGGDRSELGLTGGQEELLKKLHATGKPVVLVLTGGSPIAANWAAENIPAILMAWYPGEEGGTAVADVLFGRYNPAGRLPVTFIKSLDDIPPFEDYAMRGRTYKYMDKAPLYPFGHGLSYTAFKYSNIKLNRKSLMQGQSLVAMAELTNTGGLPGEEAAQLYISALDGQADFPRTRLAGFKRIALKPSHTRTVKFNLNSKQFLSHKPDGEPYLAHGRYSLAIGGGQPMYEQSGSVSAVLNLKGGV